MMYTHNHYKVYCVYSKIITRLKVECWLRTIKLTIGIRQIETFRNILLILKIINYKYYYYTRNLEISNILYTFIESQCIILFIR